MEMEAVHLRESFIHELSHVSRLFEGSALTEGGGHGTTGKEWMVCRGRGLQGFADHEQGAAFVFPESEPDGESLKGRLTHQACSSAQRTY
jgi:hypothetical protein